MDAQKVKWILRLGLPAACVLISMLCGKSFGAAIGTMGWTVLMLLIFVACPFLFVGIIFMPVFGLYGLKYDSKNELPMDLHDPDTQFFLYMGIPATLLIQFLLSL